MPLNESYFRNHANVQIIEMDFTTLEVPRNPKMVRARQASTWWHEQRMEPGYLKTPKSHWWTRELQHYSIYSIQFLIYRIYAKYSDSLEEIDMLSGEVTCQNCFVPIWKGVSSIRYELAPKRSRFFPYTVHPFLKGMVNRKANRKLLNHLHFDYSPGVSLHVNCVPCLS